MALREFRDSEGRPWRVWDIDPSQLAARPVLQPARDGDGVRAGEGLNDGWLCFEGTQEKRRLAPVPEDWSRLEDHELERLMQDAKQVRRRHL